MKLKILRLKFSFILTGIFMQLDVKLKPHARHSTTAVKVDSQMTEVTMFGGVVKQIDSSDEDITSETVLFQFGENNNYCCIQKL